MPNTLDSFSIFDFKDGLNKTFGIVLNFFKKTKVLFDNNSELYIYIYIYQ